MLQQAQIENAQRTYNTGMDNLVTNATVGGIQSGVDIIGGLITASPGSVMGGINRGLETYGNYVTGERSTETSYANTSRSANTDYQMSIASTLAK